VAGEGAAEGGEDAHHTEEGQQPRSESEHREREEGEQREGRVEGQVAQPSSERSERKRGDEDDERRVE
jgi:hypothetical protein